MGFANFRTLTKCKCICNGNRARSESRLGSILSLNSSTNMGPYWNPYEKWFLHQRGVLRRGIIFYLELFLNDGAL